jgi:hypothetical protein
MKKDESKNSTGENFQRNVVAVFRGPDGEQTIKALEAIRYKSKRSLGQQVAWIVTEWLADHEEAPIGFMR